MRAIFKKTLHIRCPWSGLLTHAVFVPKTER